MLEHIRKLRQDMDFTRSAIESLLEEYRSLMDGDMAGVIASYVRALQLDFELALGAGRWDELACIVEDMAELHWDTRERLQGDWLPDIAAPPLQS